MSRRVSSSLAVLAPAMLTLGALLAACSPSGNTATRNDLDAAPPKTTRLAVTTVAARPGTLSANRSVAANIRAVRDSQVAAQSGGAVRARLVSEGERVAAGQVVVQLDDTTQRQALENARLQVQQAQISLQQTQQNVAGSGGALEAAVTSAQATLAQATQSAQSSENLYRLGGISLADLQTARAALAQAQGGLAQARQNLAQNGRSAQASVPLQRAQLDTAQAGVRQAEQNLARTQVRAPFAGVVADIGVEEGEFAAQGSTVFRLVDPAGIQARFNVPPADAAALTDGTRLNLGYGGVNYVAVVRGNPAVAGTDRLVPVTANVQGGERLPVGASAQVRYRAALGRGVIVPGAAVQSDGGENSVYVAENGVARRQAVNVVAEAGAQAAVTGLEAGAPVISPVPTSLQDGDAVEVGRAAAATVPAAPATSGQGSQP